MNSGEILVLTHVPYILIALFILGELIAMRLYLSKMKRMLDIK
jgi:hypothetical protein